MTVRDHNRRAVKAKPEPVKKEKETEAAPKEAEEKEGVKIMPRRSKTTGRFLKTKKKRKTTKKGNRRKGAVRGARLAYDAVPKKKKRKRRKKAKRGLFSKI